MANHPEAATDEAERDAKNIIQLRDTSKTFSTAAGDFTAIRGLNLSLAAGELVAVVGKSGSGKSTLLNLIAGIDRPTTGEVMVAGAAVHSLSESKLAAWRGRNVGVVFQFFQLLPTLSVVENVILPMELCRTLSSAKARARAMSLLDDVGVLDQARKLPAELSAGQQQRVAIARALANDPPVLVADEPTGNLDSQTAERVLGLLAQQQRKGRTILMVTHERDPGRHVDRIVTLADGAIVADSGTDRRGPER